MEIWKNIPEWCGIYQASTFGSIRSLRFRKIKILSQCKTKTGYQLVCLWSNGPHTVIVHRLIAITFIPNQRNLKEVNHKDGDKSNNAVSNLEWCTRGENNSHAYRTGLMPLRVGEKNGFSKLTNDEVLEILQLHKMYGTKQRAIAREYDVDHYTIARIINGSGWRHLQ